MSEMYINLPEDVITAELSDIAEGSLCEECSDYHIDMFVLYGHRDHPEIILRMKYYNSVLCEHLGTFLHGNKDVVCAIKETPAGAVAVSLREDLNGALSEAKLHEIKWNGDGRYIDTTDFIPIQINNFVNKETECRHS